MMGVVGRFQAGREPELEEGGSRLYLVGMFGVAKLAAVPGTGTVIAVPTYREVHPQLRDVNPDGFVPVVLERFRRKDPRAIGDDSFLAETVLEDVSFL